MRAKSGALRGAGPVHQPAPKRLPRLLFGDEAARAHKAVPIVGLAVSEADLVQHAVGVERMVLSERLVDLVLGVAKVDAVDIAGDGAFNDLKVKGVDFLIERCPGPVEVRVVAGAQRGLHRRQALDFHAKSPTRSCAAAAHLHARYHMHLLKQVTRPAGRLGRAKGLLQQGCVPGRSAQIVMVEAKKCE